VSDSQRIVPEVPEVAAPDTATTPLMAQYLAMKRQHPDALLFYRMGDFYELFFEDAVKAAAALDIVQTTRGTHLGEPIKMCGVPIHAAEGYLNRLIRAGFKVAVCEQTEDPAEAKKRGSKSVVRRDVVRVVTPGTLTEDGLLEARRHNYLCALGEAGNAIGLSWVDISTGQFRAQAIDRKALPAALARLDPTEILLPERLLLQSDLYELFQDWKAALSPLPNARFDSENARLRLQTFHKVAALDAFGAFTRAELAAAGAILDYVELTQQGKMPRLSHLARIGAGAILEIDAATRRNLELARTLGGDRQGSLLAIIDRTVTGAGARLLGEWLSAPLTDITAIAQRQDAVGHLLGEPRLREDLRANLRKAPDLERALSRLSLDRGGPRDLAAIRDGLTAAAEIKTLISDRRFAIPPALLQSALVDLGHHFDVIDRLARALGDGLPLIARDGGFIAENYLPELDQWRTLRDDSRKLILELEARYRTDLGITSLKIKHNNVLGYFVEATITQADKVKADTRFIQRQSTANATRFTTVELGELETKISQAADKAVALELSLFADLVSEVTARADGISKAAGALALIDVTGGLADLAETETWSRPRVVGDGVFRIARGRHPVVEAALKRGGDSFVANDCDLSDGRRLWLVTGPNMAGKSTFLRQNALIVILAQMGSFVPAEAAEIGVVDKLFSRVGAADDLARGRSTFMVEMVETAAILNQATAETLVILDEIGRGTATFDGLSIAWATLEHLHEVNKCRALFATHYHELTSLAARLPEMKPHTMKVMEWQGSVKFLHEIAPGAADRSYGIHVAELAGLPAAVIQRAQEVLGTLEQGEQAGALARLADDLPLFSATVTTTTKGPGASEPRALERALAEINPDELTPKEALEVLYRLRSIEH
jgi:DNA mismatch repair protein MutS